MPFALRQFPLTFVSPPIAAGSSREARAAIEAASANFMITDTDGTILALKASSAAMFRAAEADLRQVLPGFDAAALIGANVTTFGGDLNHELTAVRRERPGDEGSVLSLEMQR